MTSLSTVIDELRPDGTSYAIDAPIAWGQGRTLYGGITAALAYAAVARAHDDLPPLRSAQFAFIGPASGRLRFNSSVLRRGRSSAMVACDCANEEGAVARALFAFGAPRASEVAHEYLTAPRVPAPEAAPPFRSTAPTVRGFWDNFETRLASGARLLDRTADHPEFTVWTRLLEGGGVDPVTAMLAIADCLPPAAMTQFPKLAPISTMTWSIDVLAAPASADGWFLLASSSEHSADGYSMQSMTMWDEAGAPLAVGRQAVAIFV